MAFVIFLILLAVAMKTGIDILWDIFFGGKK